MAEIVYVLTNEAMDGLVKIGRTTTSVEQRIKELDNTSIPLPFQCFFAGEVTDAMKWFKPTRDQFTISYRDVNGNTANYEPDFVVETNTQKFIIEPKQASLMTDANVLAKKNSAVKWCENASKYEQSNGGKPWMYVLVPHTAILPSATLKGLVQQYGNR
jgi:T5orf172 domain